MDLSMSASRSGHLSTRTGEGMADGVGASAGTSTALSPGTSAATISLSTSASIVLRGKTVRMSAAGVPKVHGIGSAGSSPVNVIAATSGWTSHAMPLVRSSTTRTTLLPPFALSVAFRRRNSMPTVTAPRQISDSACLANRSVQSAPPLRIDGDRPVVASR